MCSYKLPSPFEAGRRAGAGGMVVGFAIAPGFRLGKAAVVSVRVVYLVPRGNVW